MKLTHYCMWFHPVSVNKNVQKYILPKLCLTPEIKSKYFRIGECVGIGQTTVTDQIYEVSFQNINFVPSPWGLAALLRVDTEKINLLEKMFAVAGYHAVVCDAFIFGNNKHGF